MFFVIHRYDVNALISLLSDLGIEQFVLSFNGRDCTVMLNQSIDIALVADMIVRL